MSLTKKVENGKTVYRLDGKKLYPVCSWEKNQHKLYNANDRAQLALYDAQDANDLDAMDKAYDEIERVQNALDVFDRFVIEGIVYATWEDGLVIKDIVWAYNARQY